MMVSIMIADTMTLIKRNIVSARRLRVFRSSLKINNTVGTYNIKHCDVFGQIIFCTSPTKIYSV